MDTTAIIAGVIQEGYEDATQTHLDHQVARKIEQTLRNRGWADFETVALLVVAAGGRIEIPTRLFIDPPVGQLRSWHDYEKDKMVVEHRERKVSDQ